MPNLPIKLKNSSGFTLMELLIVMVIIGLLSTSVAVAFSSAQKKARDAKRMTELSQFRTQLETYANAHDGLYPSRTAAAGVPASTTLCADLGLGTSCATDPTNSGNFVYKYQSDGSGAGVIDASKYVLYGYLEQPNPSTNVYFGLCSTGKSLSQSTLPDVTACP